MPKAQNVLWIMCDQLRFDYLGCYGHPHLKTPHIDALAARGVRFTKAYVQSPICGPSRMSFYTGRYVHSHGSTWNGFPLRVGEPTLGDHLKDIDVRNVLVGKTHMAADTEGMARLGLDPESIIGAHVAQCGFEVFERDDGLHPDESPNSDIAYNQYLKAKGYDGENPWQDWANSANGEEDEVLSGWLMSHVDRAARVAEEDSETPYMTRRAMSFIDGAGAQPWCLHLSFIKPHWPYIVPAPYHDMYGADDVLPAVRSAREKDNTHPVFSSFMEERVARAFSKDDVRNRVIPAYMGLIKQIDDQIGVLMAFLEEKGLLDTTMVVFTSDHGDYLGDHWLGEKELFHEPSVKIPLIICDPRPEAKDAQGTTCDALVESIDLAPTFFEFFGGTARPHILEGRSLAPLLQGKNPSNWRQYVISEYDYSMRGARIDLNVAVTDCRLMMIADTKWKYIHAEGMRPMLFNLVDDPQELDDLGDNPDYQDIRQKMHEALFEWTRRHHNRVTVSDEAINNSYGKETERGILIGYWDESELKN